MHPTNNRQSLLTKRVAEINSKRRERYKQMASTRKEELLLKRRLTGQTPAATVLSSCLYTLPTREIIPAQKALTIREPSFLNEKGNTSHDGFTLVPGKGKSIVGVDVANTLRIDAFILASAKGKTTVGAEIGSTSVGPNRRPNGEVTHSDTTPNATGPSSVFELGSTSVTANEAHNYNLATAVKKDFFECSSGVMYLTANGDVP